jgi:c-di-GMP-binding flagellar brake protein YcgR
MPDANMFFERRVHPRISLKIPVKYRVVDDLNEIKTVTEHKINNQASHTMDVSLGGLYLVADQALGVGTILRVEISIPEISHMITAFAEVVWSNETGGGLHFDAMKEEDLESLKRYLSQKPPR